MWRASIRQRRGGRATASAAPTPRARRGLSLFEAVAALAIIGATSAGALAAVGGGLRAAERARRAHEADALAQEITARLMLADVVALRALPDSLAEGAFAPPFDDYQWRVDVRPHGARPGVFDTRITIEWTDGIQQTTSAIYRRPAAVVLEAP